MVRDLRLRAGGWTISARFDLDGPAATIGVVCDDETGLLGYAVFPGETRWVILGHDMAALAFDDHGVPVNGTQVAVRPGRGRQWHLTRPLVPRALYNVTVVASADEVTYGPPLLGLVRLGNRTPRPAPRYVAVPPPPPPQSAPPPPLAFPPPPPPEVVLLPAQSVSRPPYDHAADPDDEDAPAESTPEPGRFARWAQRHFRY